MALFKRNNNKEQAAEDLAENQAEDTSQDAPGANAEDVPGEDSAPEQAPPRASASANASASPNAICAAWCASRSWSRRWPTRTSTTSTPTRLYLCICPSAAWSASARRCCAWTSCKGPRGAGTCLWRAVRPVVYAGKHGQLHHQPQPPGAVPPRRGHCRQRRL